MLYFKKKNFYFKKKKDKYFILNQKRGAIITLNETSFFLWQKLEDHCSVKDLVGLLTSEYDIESSQAKIDIEDFLKVASKSGIIEKVK